MNAYLFVGPTLSADDARASLPGLHVLPPVALGDVYRVGQRRPLVIGIVDGYFERRPAVYHKELLWALDQGIHVLGASSMGALRAAELAAFGMEGVGAIYASFADGTLMADDEVAVAHASEGDAYRQMSEALVNIRATTARALDEQVVSEATAELVIKAARALYYPDRVWPEILRSATDAGATTEDIARLRRWLLGNTVNQKRIDAMALIERMVEIVEHGTAATSDFYFSNTSFWSNARDAIDLESDPSAPHDVNVDDVLEELRLEPEQYRQAIGLARTRYLALSVAQHHAVQPETMAVLEEAVALRRLHALRGSDDVEVWQRANGLSDGEFTRLLTDESRIRWVTTAADAALRSYLVDYLRVSGRYASLARRARAKRARLTELGLEMATFEVIGLEESDIVDWFNQRRPDQMPPAEGSSDLPWLDATPGNLGFTARPEMLRALVREYLYRASAQETPSETLHSTD